MIKLKTLLERQKLLTEKNKISQYREKQGSTYDVRDANFSGDGGRIFLSAFEENETHPDVVIKKFDNVGELVQLLTKHFNVKVSGWDSWGGKFILSLVDIEIGPSGWPKYKYDVQRDADKHRKWFAEEYQLTDEQIDAGVKSLRQDPKFKSAVKATRLAYERGFRGGYYRDLLRKMSLETGVAPQMILDTIGEINRVQSKSYQKLNPKFYSALRALTLGNLPRVIYRGFFYDGAKIKDREKFLQKWKIGSSPKEGLGKPTSWSKSKYTAAEFTVIQDKVKDEENGFHIIIRIDNPTKDELIADFSSPFIRQFSRFFNQQEVIVDPKCKRYVVEDISPIIRDDRGYTSNPITTSKMNTKFNSTRAKTYGANQGAWGSSYNEILHKPFDVATYDFGPDLKIELKSLFAIPVKQIKGYRDTYHRDNSSLFNHMKSCTLPLSVFGDTVISTLKGACMKKYPSTGFNPWSAYNELYSDTYFSVNVSLTHIELKSKPDVIQSKVNDDRTYLFSLDDKFKEMLKTPVEIKISQTSLDPYALAFTVKIKGLSGAIKSQFTTALKEEFSKYTSLKLTIT